MDTHGGVHDLFSDMYRHSGGVARSLPDQSASDSHYGQYSSPVDHSRSAAQPDSLYPSSSYGYRPNQPSSPGTVGSLFSAAGLQSSSNADPNMYGGTYTNGNTDEYSQYRFGRPIESAGSTASHGGSSSGYASFDGQSSNVGTAYDPYSNYATQDTDYSAGDPYSQTIGNDEYGNFLRQLSGDGVIPDPNTYSSLERQYSYHSSAPHTPYVQEEEPTYPYSVTTPNRDEPNFTYKPTNASTSTTDVSHPYNQSVSSSSVSELSELSGPQGGHPIQRWDDELTSTWSTQPPPSEPPPPPPADEVPAENMADEAASGHSDPSIPVPPPLPAASGSPAGPQPPAPPPPPPLPTSKPPGPINSTGTHGLNKNNEQVKIVWKKV